MGDVADAGGGGVANKPRCLVLMAPFSKGLQL